MWTFTNVVALGLFLFGSTLWMTPAMAGTTPPPTGTAWTLTNLLSFVAVLGFTVAAWALYRQYAWWDTAALVSSIVGLVAVVPFIVGQSQLDVGFGGRERCGRSFLRLCPSGTGGVLRSRTP